MSEHNIPYDLPYHAAEIIEPRLDKIKASRWTDITSSDDLVRRLLAAYLQYDMPYNTPFHVDHFLDDMVAGRENYCTPLLVNAVLAVATVSIFSNPPIRGTRAALTELHQHGIVDDPERVDFWDPQNLGCQFWTEAQRLWHARDRQNITTVHAAFLFAELWNMWGFQENARGYLVEAVNAAKEIGLFLPSLKFANARQQTVYAVTAWNLFSWQA